MKLTITRRIFLALTASSLVILALNVGVWRWNFQRGFLDYVAQQETETLTDVAAALADIHARDGSWSSIAGNPQRWMQLVGPDNPGPPALKPSPQRQSGKRPSSDRPPGRGRGGGPPPRDGRPPHRPGGPESSLDAGHRLSLLDADGRKVIGPPGSQEDRRRVPIVVDGNTVGFLTLKPRLSLTNPVDQQFAEDQQQGILVVAVASLLLAAVIAALLARQLTQPLRKLRDGARSMTDGRFDTRIASKREDELGDLARDFNRLAATLEKNQASRRQWVADIAHELRTPLAVLRAELDAIEDGVRQFDATTRESLQADVSRLTQLVADLHDLSGYDEGGLNYRFEAVDLPALLDDTMRNAGNRLKDAGLALTWQRPDQGITVRADPARLQQLMTNLIENSIRYTDQPGTLTVSCVADARFARIEVADSAPGVPDEALPKLFDRLFRVDRSRSRATGGSGLGLAICKAIVAAHHGTIDAHHSAAGGVAIRVALPLTDAGDTAP